MNAKYVVVNYPMVGETMFIFPDYVKHKNFSMDIGHTVVSAGFVTLRDGELYCYGESVGLHIQARPEEDGILANMMFRRK